MTIFRWVIGVLSGLLAVGALLSLVIAVVSASDIWYGRARRLIYWVWLAALFWFNIEVWGRVVWTLLHWNR
jgi:hypothetical protein